MLELASPLALAFSLSTAILPSCLSKEQVQEVGKGHDTMQKKLDYTLNPMLCNRASS